MDQKREELNLNLEATELRLGPPGETQTPPARNKRGLLPDMNESDNPPVAGTRTQIGAAPPTKAQVVGWPPIRSYRRNSLQIQASKSNGGEAEAGMYVKVSMDGAPYLRKIDLQMYEGYQKLLKALQQMFNFRIGEYSEKEGYGGSEFVPTYDDKDGDNMLVGDVPWDMFITSCKRLRIKKASETRGLGF